MHRSGLVHGENAEGLIGAVALLNESHDAGAFENGLIPIAAQAGHVQQNILHAVVRHDEAEAFATSNHLMTPVISIRSSASPPNSSLASMPLVEILSAIPFSPSSTHHDRCG